jgi:hypothetical protein
MLGEAARVSQAVDGLILLAFGWGLLLGALGGSTLMQQQMLERVEAALERGKREGFKAGREEQAWQVAMHQHCPVVNPEARASMTCAESWPTEAMTEARAKVASHPSFGRSLGRPSPPSSDPPAPAKRS